MNNINTPTIARQNPTRYPHVKFDNEFKRKPTGPTGPSGIGLLLLFIACLAVAAGVAQKLP